MAAHLKPTGVAASVVVPGAIGGEHNMWRTMRIAGADRMVPDEVERIRAEARAMSRGWPAPESMATTIVDGIRSGRVYIFQKGEGPYEDWERKLMHDKASDPDAFVLRER